MGNAGAQGRIEDTSLRRSSSRVGTFQPINPPYPSPQLPVNPREELPSLNASYSRFAINAVPHLPVDPRGAFPSLEAANPGFPNASPPHGHQVNNAGMSYAEVPMLSVDASCQGLCPPPLHHQFGYPAFDTSTHWQQQTSSVLPELCLGDTKLALQRIPSSNRKSK
jgi:hypothetical protein